MVWSEGHSLNGGQYRIVEKVGRGGFGLTYRVIADYGILFEIAANF